jgi:hypothetical protein
MQTRSGKMYTTHGSNIPGSNIANELAELLGKPVEAKTLSAQDLRRMLRFIYDKYAGGGQPREISNQLARFLGKPAGSKMRRTEVLRDIENYLDSNNLIDNEARIKPDRRLAAIIKMGENRELTYFNLLKHLNHHFV